MLLLARRPKPRPVFHADVVSWAAAVVSGGGTVSQRHKAIKHSLVSDLVAGGVYTRLGDFWALAAENDTQRKVSFKHHTVATVIGTPTTSGHGGYTFNGTSDALDTNYTPASPLVGNDLALGTYEFTNVASNGMTLGVNNGTTKNLTLRHRSATGQFQGSADAAATSITGHLDSRGYHAYSRTPAGVFEHWYLGASLGTTTPGSSATVLPVNSLTFAARNTNGTPDSFRACTINWGDVRQSLTSAQELAIATAVEAYMTAMGASWLPNLALDEPSSLTATVPHRIFNNGTVTLSGTVVGRDSATVEAKVTNSVGGATVVDWTTLATVVGGIYAGSVSVPAGGPYKVQVRLADLSATSPICVNPFSVGRVIALVGESLMSFSCSINDTSTALTGPGRRFTNGAYGGWPLGDAARGAGEGVGEHNGDGAIHLFNLMDAALAIPIGQVQVAVMGTTLGQWVNGGTPKANLYGGNCWQLYVGTMTAAVAAPGWNVDLTAMRTGINDAEAPTPKATFAAQLDQFLADDRTAKGNANAPFTITITGRSTTAVDSDMNDITQAILEFLDANAGSHVHCAGNTKVLPLADSHHWTLPGRLEADAWLARTWLHVIGEETYGAAGPLVDTATATGNTIMIAVTQSGGSTLKDISGSTSGTGITGFRARVNGVLRTITAAALSSGTIVLTVNGAAFGLSDVVEFDYHYGTNPNVTNPVFDDDVVDGAVLFPGLPLQPTRGWVAAVVS